MKMKGMSPYCLIYFSGKNSQRKKKFHASLNFQRFPSLNLFILSFAKCWEIVNSGVLTGLALSHMIAKRQGNYRCCLLFRFSLQKNSVFFHRHFCNARYRACFHFWKPLRILGLFSSSPTDFQGTKSGSL